MILMKRALDLVLAALLIVGSAGVLEVSAAERTPLLQPGKQTLYQRVLTRPGARLYETPGASVGRVLDAFSRLYVYAETEHAGATWRAVGTDAKGGLIGWLRGSETVPWLQQIALAFTNPGAERERALFFESWEALRGILELPDPAAQATPLTRRIAEGGRDPRVVAIEPDRFIDINTRFYLLPILAHEELFTESGHLIYGLKVASVSESAEQVLTTVVAEDSTGGADTAGEVSHLGSFRAAVVFVIDSTISMQPYIDEARAAAKQVYQRIEGSGLLDKVAFGLVAYRAPSVDPGRAKALDYVAKLFVDPAQVSSGLDFLTRAAEVVEARVSTDQFDEDAYAGILAALEQIPWNRFGARYVLLITDAGALEGTTSATGLHAEQVRSEAAEQGVALLVLHLKTPAGQADHAAAETQYRTLASNPAIQRTLYFPVEQGSAEALGRAVSTLADSVIENIQMASRGELAAGSARASTAVAGQVKPSVPVPDPQAGALREAAQALGYAMQLAYLGRVEGTSAPTLFEGWMSDRDLVDPTLRTVDARVLLTKAQLSDLHAILKQIVDAADSGMLEPDRFFESLRSIAAQFGRNPELAASPQATKLADLGLLGEYLDGLPYKSDVMLLDQDTWSRWGPQRQFEFVTRLKGKMRLYERYNADTDRWISLAEGSPPAESVYPVPLLDLP